MWQKFTIINIFFISQNFGEPLGLLSSLKGFKSKTVDCNSALEGFKHPLALLGHTKDTLLSNCENNKKKIEEVKKSPGSETFNLGLNKFGFFSDQDLKKTTGYHKHSRKEKRSLYEKHAHPPIYEDYHNCTRVRTERYVCKFPKKISVVTY